MGLGIEVWKAPTTFGAGACLAIDPRGFNPMLAVCIYLTNTAIAMHRLDFMHRREPAFGSWVFHYKVRDPATDNPRFALHDTRGVDFTAAGSTSYWVDVVQAAGVWRTTFQRENGAALLTVDHTLPPPGAECTILLTRHVSGNWRMYVWIAGMGWRGETNVIANDVTYLNTNYVSFAPRGSWIMDSRKLLGEVTSDELV